MSKQEFMYDHDYDSIVDLINREIEFMGLGRTTKTEVFTDPREFFI